MTSPIHTRKSNPHLNQFKFQPPRSVADGVGVDLTLEFMYAAAYSNLYTNIHMGAASEPFGWTVRGQVGGLAGGCGVWGPAWSGGRVEGGWLAAGWDGRDVEVRRREAEHTGQLTNSTTTTLTGSQRLEHLLEHQDQRQQDDAPPLHLGAAGDVGGRRGGARGE
jgi:hypothetical protein